MPAQAIERIYDENVLHPSGYLDVANSSGYDRCHAYARAYLFFHGGIKLSGQENYPEDPMSYVKAMNHDSGSDFFLAKEIDYRNLDGARVHSVAKNSLLRFPFRSWFINHGVMSVNRNQNPVSQPKFLRDFGYVAMHTGIIEWFPQGTRKNHRRGEVLPEQILDGVIWMAMHYGLPIQPVGLVGTGSLKGLTRYTPETAKSEAHDRVRDELRYGLFPHAHIGAMMPVAKRDLGLDQIVAAEFAPVEGLSEIEAEAVFQSLGLRGPVNDFRRKHPGKPLDPHLISRGAARRSLRMIKDHDEEIQDAKSDLAVRMKAAVDEASSRRTDYIQESVPRRIAATLLRAA